MKERFTRTTHFVREHKIAIAFGTAAVVGGTLGVIVGRRNAPGTVLRLALTSEQLQGLIENTESVISFDMGPKAKIWIINAATREVFP